MGLYDRGGGSNMTRSLGLVFVPANNGVSCHFEIVYNEEKDPAILNFYQKVLNLLGGFEKIKETQFRKLLSPNDGFNAASQFLDDIKPAIDELVKQSDLQRLFIEETDFNKKLETVLRIQNDAYKGLIPIEKVPILKNKFKDYKQTQSYQNRIRQLKFVPFAKEVIERALQGELTNELLTGILQITNNRSKEANVIKYINRNVQDPDARKNLTEWYHDLQLSGFTTSSKGSITGLNSAQLSDIKDFLAKSLNINLIEKSIDLVEEFENKEIPYVKKGIYSPWLYYLNASVFPIQNNSHNGFISWCEQDIDDYGLAIKLFHEVAEILNEKDLGIIDAFTHTYTIGDTRNSNRNSDTIVMTHPLNTILYGPPGTGKTYNTIDRAVMIANPLFDIRGKARSEIKEEYERLKKEGQIEFATFHQSMSYEDFIEGIKPLKPDGDNFVKYDVVPGIFKILCERASYKPDIKVKDFHLTDAEFENAVFYKISLGNTLDSEDGNIYQYCIDNNLIALGWGDDIDFTGKSESDITAMGKDKLLESYGVTAVKYFVHYIKEGDFVVVSKGNSSFRAIGRITGSYFYEAEPSIRYHQFRSVEWILKDVNIPVNELYNRVFSQQSIYTLAKDDIKPAFFIKGNDEADISTKNYVLIIDEINRGNVSQIFGELITLIETDKRKGNDEELEIRLPYSKDIFAVPDNLFIIGTMNTADRSVEALDTALRRRFAFEECIPIASLLHPKNLIANFWNKHVQGQYENLDEDQYNLMNDQFYSLTGFDNETEEQVVDSDDNPERDYWLSVDFDRLDQTIFDRGIRLDKLLEAINIRIEKLLSKDQQIGHAFFINVMSIRQLYEVFYQKLIPQMQEYFYGDFGKIGLVIGSAFVYSDDSNFQFADFEYDDSDLLLQRRVYKVNMFKEGNTINLDLFETTVRQIYSQKKPKRDGE